MTTPHDKSAVERLVATLRQSYTPTDEAADLIESLAAECERLRELAQVRLRAQEAAVERHAQALQRAAEAEREIYKLRPPWTLVPVTHRKTGNTYYLNAKAIDATNERDGTEVMVYRNTDGQVFVRELQEFNRKFRLADEAAALAQGKEGKS